MISTESLTQVQDLFLRTKSRELRNKTKKLDKIKQTENQIKSGKINPNETQTKMLESKPELEKEVANLQALIDLYIQSNPDWDKLPAKKVQAIAHHLSEAAMKESLMNDLASLSVKNNDWEQKAEIFAKKWADFCLKPVEESKVIEES